MYLATARFTALLLTGLLAGSSLANYLLENSLSEPAAFNIEYKQLVIRAYTVALPVLGLGALFAALAVLYLTRRAKISRWPTFGAVLSIILGLAITLTIHFPINDQVLSWSPGAPPPDWRQLLDHWETGNTLRTATAITAFGLLLVPIRTQTRRSASTDAVT